MTTPDRLSGRKTLKNVSNILEDFEKDRIKEQVDLVDLFESFGVKLTKKGEHWKGLCPWHSDHTPSLSVSPHVNNGVYNCFSCDAAGDAFTLVQKMKGLDFKGSLEYLKAKIQTTSISRVQEKIVEEVILKPMEVIEKIEIVKAPVVEELFPIQETSSFSFEDIVHHWIERLHHNESAQKYLEGRGLSNKQNHDFFSVGFSDGSLVEKLSETQKKKLIEIGILNDKGREVFEGFVIVPLIAADNRIKGIYGRSISEKKSIKHLYLKGPLHGLINRKAFPIYRDRMILTESVIDALSLYELDIKNVCACYGTNGFKDEHLKALKENMVKEVVIAFDADEAGRKSSSELKERLISEGFSVKVIEPAVGKDWNESLTTGMSRQDLEAIINDAPIYKTSDNKPNFEIKQDSTKTVFTFGEITYQIMGLRGFFAGSLRVSIRAQKAEKKHIDNLDLYSSRSRNSFSQNAARLMECEEARVEKDLVVILDWIEARRDRELMGNEEKTIVLTEEQRELGMSFLLSPTLMDDLVADTRELGYVGEDINKQLLYLAATSRKTEDPLSVIVLSESSSGKSYLMETIKRLMPEEDVVNVTSLSDQALNYLPSDGLLHKFLVMGEAMHGETIEHQIREMLSGKALSRLVTTKDQKTGEMTSKIVSKKAIVSLVMSTTDYNINAENASRCFVVNTDESIEQTLAIHQKQKQKYSLNRQEAKNKSIPVIIEKHQAAQRLLQNMAVVNPFAQYIDFPAQMMRSRRDHERFLDLIAAVCFLRQYQKEKLQNEDMEYIECDLVDYSIAYAIMKTILPMTLSSFPSAAIQLYNELRKIAKRVGQEQSIEADEVKVSQREIREATGLGQMFVKRNIRLLQDYEYIKSQIATRGQKKSYRLAADEDLSLVDLSMIPSPQQMKETMNKKEMKFSI